MLYCMQHAHAGNLITSCHVVYMHAVCIHSMHYFHHACIQFCCTAMLYGSVHACMSHRHACTACKYACITACCMHVFIHHSMQCHVLMQRKYIRETDSSELLSDLHRTFSAWVAEKNLSNPTEEEWGEVMLEDERWLVMFIYNYACMVDCFAFHMQMLQRPRTGGGCAAA